MPDGRGMGSTSWDPKSRVRQENASRERWYGLRPGDIVTLKGPGGYLEEGLEVVGLHSMDNNGCTVRRRMKGRGKPTRDFKAVCEWCTVTTKVEDR